MNRNQKPLVMSDGAFLLLFILCVICVIFTAGDPDRYLLNMILLNFAFFAAILTYFTSVTTGLIFNLLFIFGYGTYVLYEIVVEGAAVAGQSYFWLVMTPALTAATWMLTHANRQLQLENNRLQAANASLATLDELTQLKNSLSFQKDAEMLMALSVRYQIPLTLLIANVKYWDEMSRFVSKQQLTEVITEVSKINEDNIRTNDSLYFLNAADPSWGILLFTNREGADIVIHRLREKIDAFSQTHAHSSRRIKLQLKIGVVQYDPDTIKSPLDWIAQTNQQQEFDV